MTETPKLTDDFTAILLIQEALGAIDPNLKARPVTISIPDADAVPYVSDTPLGYGHTRIEVGTLDEQHIRVLCRALSAVTDVATTRGLDGKSLRFHGTVEQLAKVDAAQLVAKIGEVQRQTPPPYRGGPGWSI